MASNHHCFMKPSSWDQQRLTSPLEYAVGPKTANTKTPTLKMRWGAECKSPQPPPPPEEGRGEVFFLTFFFIRLGSWRFLVYLEATNAASRFAGLILTYARYDLITWSFVGVLRIYPTRT